MSDALLALTTQATSNAVDSGGVLTALVPLALSLVAVVFSGVALWRTHFSKGDVVFAVGQARISITHWENDGHEWFTPDITITVSIANTGVRPLIVQGLRVRVDYDTLPISDAHEIWSFNQEIDTTTALKWGKGRAVLQAKKGAGLPWIVLAKSNIDKRFVCWARWDQPVVQPMRFTLEAKTSRSDEWVVVDRWGFNLTGQWWVDMTGAGRIVTLRPWREDAVGSDGFRSPQELHDYTGPSEPLPDSPRKATTSNVVLTPDEHEEPA